MVGQNLLLELIEGDKVQLYVYTGAGISDHKNSHYTQFIGCLLRPSVETLHAVMRRLGSSDALEDDVSTADGDISMRGGKGINGNGDASLMGRSRRGGSKSRVLSPPPAQPPANQNSASTSDVTNEVITEEIEPPQVVSNGVHHEKNEAKDQKSQSYLALTKLGMGGSNKTKNGVEENNNKKESPKEGKKSKDTNGVNGKESKKKSMAEMATSTLKGFTKM